MKHYVGKLNIMQGDGPAVVTLTLVKAADYKKARAKAIKVARRFLGKPDPGQKLSALTTYFHNGGSYVMLNQLHEITKEDYTVIERYLL